MLDNTMIADAIVCVIAIGCLIAAVLIIKANKAAYESGYDDGYEEGYLDALDERRRNLRMESEGDVSRWSRGAA